MTSLLLHVTSEAFFDQIAEKFDEGWKMDPKLTPEIAWPNFNRVVTYAAVSKLGWDSSSRG